MEYLDQDNSYLKEEEENHYSYQMETLLNSAIISTISIIEYGLKEFCELICKENLYKIKLKHLRNSYIEASKNYLDLVADIKLDSINKNFEDINTYRKIRNSFIHSLGKISQEELETLNNFISGYSKVKLHKSYISILNPNFVFKLIEISLDLFNKLFFLYEEMSNFKRLKDALDYFFGKDRVKSSEVSSEGLLKVKYKVILDLNGSMQEVTVKISKSKISKLEFFDSSESHTELKNEIESNDYYLFRSLLPYITYNKNLLDVKVYL